LAKLEEKLSAAGHELETFREETRVQAQQLLHTQELLEKSRNRYAELFDFAPVPYLVLDRWGLIVDANLTAAGFLEVDRARILGVPFRTLVAREDRKTLLDHMRRCRKEPGRVTSELKVVTRLGDVIAVQITSRRWEDSGDGFHYATALMDLTERNRDTGVRAALMQRLMAALEEERKRISRELHDQLGQQITALMLGLRTLECTVDSPEETAQVRQLLKLADELGRDAHRVALNLRPTILDDLGLQPALSSYIDDWSRRSGIPVQYDVTGHTGRRLPSDVETVLYRVVQEALTNVLKHAKASRVSVMINITATDVSAVIEDDGQGFDAQFAFEVAIKGGRLGLVGLRERSQLLGGTLSIVSAKRRGSTVFVRVPFAARME
jgi:PAS domain S-box-containing protein